jgi:hypothetical protein
MQTITATTTATIAPITAIDLGECKRVVCVYRSPVSPRSPRSPVSQSFLSVSTCRTQLTRLLSKEQQAVVLIEACLLAGWPTELPPLTREARGPEAHAPGYRLPPFRGGRGKRTDHGFFPQRVLARRRGAW